MHKMHRAGVDNYVTHNKGRIRKLTPRECLRLMVLEITLKLMLVILRFIDKQVTQLL